ncbi:TetR family transcriptional regulator [Enemella dayhoffiae]|uniref:TetR family transcriptional regulator n=1 Tax=Enemella dayhoffiae TaxID=2016507 RepID=A0A255GNV2_9ACTN|nr:TetR/AcrR family transcriptional regulator [Enemella dayhoffiae]OYO17261.1 TetR family transcriptional regulator [Enemella dayhoffiae]
MARPAKFSTDDLLDGAQRAVVEHGLGASIGQVAAEVGAPVGSIYHRFPSREHLFVTLWMRSIRAFHVGLLATAEIDDPREALLAQAVHIPRFCRDNPQVALCMTLYRHSVLRESAPESLRTEVGELNDAVWAMVARQTEAVFGRRDEHLALVVAIAVQQCPYGLVRPFIGAQIPVPPWLDDAVVAAAGAILDLELTRP